jgi:soluble lytic murein transglycosylase-like protein
MGLDAFFKAFPSAARGAQQGYADIENTMARVENIDQFYRNAEERRFLQQNMPALGNQTIAAPRAGLALPPNPADLASTPMPGQPLPAYQVPEPEPQPAVMEQPAANAPVVGAITRPVTGQVTPEAQKDFEAATAIQPTTVEAFRPGIGPFAGKQFNFLSDGPSLVNPLLTTDKKMNESAYQATRKELERLTNEAKAKQQKAGPLAGNEEFFYYKNQLDYLDTTFNALKKRNKIVPIQAVPEQQSKTGKYEKRFAVPEIDNYELPDKLVKRFNTLRDRMPAELQKPGTQGLIARAQQFGVDPAAAVAVYALENTYGGQATSGAGARGSMQIIPDTYKGVRSYFTNTKNKMPAQLAQVAASLPTDIEKATPEQLRDAGLLYMYQLQNVYKIPTNLLGAAYHSGPGSDAYKQGIAPNKYDKVAKVWTPDYNAVYVGLYNNYVNLIGGQGQQQVVQQQRPNQQAPTQDLRDAFPNTNAKMQQVQVDNTGRTVARPEDMKPGDSLDMGRSLPEVSVTADRIRDEPAASTAPVADLALAAQRRALSMTPDQHNMEIQNILRGRQQEVQKYEQAKADAYSAYQDEFNRVNARRQQLSVQIEAARRAGNMQTVTGLLDQINTVDQSLNTMKYNYFNTVAQADNTIQTGLAGVDNNLSLAVAYQGLHDLQYRNDPTRLEQMWSRFVGYEVRVQPRTDGNFNLWVPVDGQLAPAGVYSKSQLSDVAMRQIIPTYRQQKQDAEAALNQKVLETQLKVFENTQTELAKTIGALKVEEVKGNVQMILKQIENAGFDAPKELQGPNGPVLVAISKDGSAIMEIDINPAAADKDGKFKKESIRVRQNPARMGLNTQNAPR